MRTLRLSLIVGITAVALAVAGPAAAKKTTFTWNDQPWATAPITIDQATYPDEASVPPIIVMLSSKRPNREVQLQWFNVKTKRWALETTRTSRNGVVRLSFDPICTGREGAKAYCNSAFSYRIVVRRTAKQPGVISKPVRVAFVPLPAR